MRIDHPPIIQKPKHLTEQLSTKIFETQLWATARPDAVKILNDSLTKKAFSRYFGIFQGKKPAKFIIAKNLGPDTRINVMFQYMPHWRADEVPELRRRLNNEEIQRALKIAKETGLINLVRD